ncbi:hypothetical protein CHS0354_016217 [Potamilus streckersoni]|uniref:N-acetylated-alpha-linked acidic dipeptidase 2 n=1 Tax=Potamilus streckersoni TaxID=2493646 RepID=A0AAE0VKW5_9BIVA|nr:hypothetical protein CHS0354_016217 [Potamilus streckersoni]
MPSKGKYRAGKQVSRWEADSENIDIEYKNLETPTQAPTWQTDIFVGKKGIALKILGGVVLFCIGLVLGYVIRKGVKEAEDRTAFQPVIDAGSHSTGGGSGGTSSNKDNQSEPILRIQEDYNRTLSQIIQDNLMQKINYEDDLRTITKKVRLSGVGGTNKLIHYVQQEWLTFPFDAVKHKKYSVSLSYPNYTNENGNSISVRTVNGSLLFHSHFNGSSAHPEYTPFNAYSPAKFIATTNVVYAHYGRSDDFEELKLQNISVNGSLLIIRYGKNHPASKVHNAELRGAAGVILYSDPLDYCQNQSQVYPDTWWLPDWAVQFAHVRYSLMGDPRTPDYFALSGIYQVPEDISQYPSIPVQPISYSDARYLLSNMKGPIVRNDWFGGLNITYRLGPGYVDDRLVEFSVENVIQSRSITNIFSVIEGHYEKDKYIIVGAHIDSWTEGAIDAGTGYAVLRELARSFSHHVGKGWRPRRTIMFALWDASKYGHIGAYEWVQEYEKQLSDGAIAYINLDSLIRGNYSFFARASSMLHTVIYDASKTVPCPEPGYENKTMFDLWRERFPDPINQSQPRIDSLGDYSDHGAFIYRLGIPVLEPLYNFDEKQYFNLPNYPAYNTLYDTMEYVTSFLDPEYTLHITVAKILADVILRLADSAILPLDVDNFSRVLRKGKETMYALDMVFSEAEIDLTLLTLSIDMFCMIADNFSAEIKSLNKEEISEFDLYLINNQLIQVSKAFIMEKGIPGQQHYRNVLVAPDPENLNQEIVFPGIISAIYEGKQSKQWNSLREQLAYLVISLRRASDILQNGMRTGRSDPDA